MPDQLVDVHNPHNPYGSTAVRDELVAEVCEEEYSLAKVLPLSDANRGLHASVDALMVVGDIDGLDGNDVFSTEAVGLFGDAHLIDVPASTEARQDSALGSAFRQELWLSLVARASNMFVSTFMVIALSLMALKSSVGEEAWSVLQWLGVFRSKTWTASFARQVAARLRELIHRNELFSWRVRFVAGDNCSYLSRIVFEHTGRNGEMLHTINWVSVPLRSSRPCPRRSSARATRRAPR